MDTIAATNTADKSSPAFRYAACFLSAKSFRLSGAMTTAGMQSGQSISNAALPEVLTKQRIGGSRRLAWLLLPAALLLLGIVALAASSGRDPVEFTRDPAAFHDTHPFVGVLSNIGILFWAGVTSITLFSATLLRGSDRDRELRLFLLHAGALSAWLMLDDLFMFHERLAPDDIGLPQPILFSGYALWVAFVLVRFRRLILRSDYGVLAFALGMFAVSAGLDQLAPGPWFEWKYMMLIEDGAKLLGIVSWFGYFVPVATFALMRR